MKLLHVFWGLLSLFSGCDGCKVCQKNFTFELPLTLTPSKSEYKVGDTIIISSKFSKDMIDALTHEQVRVENYDFGVRMYIGRHDTKPSQVANTYFDVKALIGEIDAQYFQVSDSTLLGGIPVTHQLKYNQLPNEYSLQLRLLAKRKGLYSIFFGSRLSNTDAGLLKNCGTGIDFLRFNLNKKSNNNYEFLQTSPDDNIKKIGKEEFDRDGYYTFYVK
jgi:hypothetical protein